MRKIRFGVIGCGLMGKEFASSAARWCHLQDLDFAPEIIAVCDMNPAAMQWFKINVPTVRTTVTNYEDLLADADIDAIYCAVPHHLHAQVYVDIIEAGKHLLGEKPFGIDQKDNQMILEAIKRKPEVLVRCSSEMPYYPGAYQISQWVEENRFGTILDVEAGLWHSSDLNPLKPINWKRKIATNGEYGCMGDLGMHVLHMPLRFGWMPKSVRALLSNIITQRPDGKGGMTYCETWDNALLACDVRTADQRFPMSITTKRIAPGHANTWFIRINGTSMSAEYSTKYPKQVTYMNYEAGGPQAWQVMDVPCVSAYPSITGHIFEFGFSDSILQMWASFCDELVNGDQMKQPFNCATPEEAAQTHKIFTAALESHKTETTVHV